MKHPKVKATMVTLAFFLGVFAIVYEPGVEHLPVAEDLGAGKTGTTTPPVTETTTKSDTASYFAKVRGDGTVETVIVADQAFINSGAVGDPAMWVETKYDGTEQAAEIRGKYDRVNDVFISRGAVERGATSSDSAVITDTTSMDSVEVSSSTELSDI